MNFEKLKETARKYEQKEDWRRAIEVYLQAIREFESGQDPVPDLSVYNRVGDLYLKANEPGAAVQAYERAADLYGEQGFYNNAIALCGKILRVNPGRTQAYLKLAFLQARKNVVIEAKKNLLEYLDRMHAQNQLDEAFSAVKNFADQFPTNKEIRLMLSELLRASSRNEEAREQLEKLATDLEARGDTIGARKTLMRLQALEADGTPVTAVPPSAKPGSKPRSADLIFLDTRAGAPKGPDSPAGPAPSRAPRKTVATPPPRLEVPAKLVADLPLIDVGEVLPIEGKMVDESLLEIETSRVAAEPLELESVQPISDEASLEASASGGVTKALGFEATIVESEAGLDVAPMEGLELDGPPPDTLDLTSSSSSLDVERMVEADDTPLEAISSGSFLVGEPIDVGDLPPGAPDLGLELGGEEMQFSESDFEITPAPEPESTAEAAGGEVLTFLEADPSADAGPSIADLEDRVLDDPDDPERHRTLGEALLAVGEQTRGQEELELALAGYEAREEWSRADDLVTELILLDPNGVRFHQKRVEVAFRTADRPRLIDAYLGLADALLRVGAMDKALAVYQRVADHDPGNQRALAALDALAPVEEAPSVAPAPEPVPEVVAPRSRPSAPTAPTPTRRPTGATVPPAAAAAPPVKKLPPAEPALAGDFIDLGALVLEDEEARDTRMKVESEEQTGDEQRDFQDMLSQFKRGIEQNIDAEDFQAHYDLGVAFKEMGLLDEAIAEFQKALRAPECRLKTTEALGMAFYEKGQYPIAEAILRRAVESLGATDDEQIGLIYWLGRALEAQGKGVQAIPTYERVLAVDIKFQDTSSRMSKLAAERGG